MSRLLTLLCFIVLILALSAGLVPAAAQSITDYALASSSSTFSPLVGGTTPSFSGTSWPDDGYANAIPIGFSFDFNGTVYTTVSVTTNGCLFPGATLSASQLSNNLTSGTPRPIIAPLWDDLELDTAAGGGFSYLTTGTAGNQVFTAQWLKVMWRYNTTPAPLSFQVKLYEADGRVEFIYQDEGGTPGNSPTASIGLAATATGSGNFLSLNGTGVSPTVSSTTETTNLSVKPANGQMYAFTRSPMSYASGTTTQNSNSVAQGAVNAQIVGVEVVMDGAITPLTITQFNLNTTGSTSAADILNARVFFTAGSNTYATATPFGSTVASPSGAFNVTGSQVLVPGTNYFWVAYDVSPTATVNNVLDAQCTQITVDGVNRTPTVTAPAGSRQIRAALSGTYTINAGGGGGTNYTTFTAAVADINALGISGQVTFNVSSGQVFDGPIVITATGTLSNSIIFQKSGAGANPVIEAPGTVSTTDAIVTLSGSDYITFDGIDVRPTAGSTAMEWGYYLLARTGDGCKSNTIRNCVITMDRTNTGSRGVYTSSFAAAAAGANTGNQFHNNTVRNSYTGYWLNGSSSAADDDNEIATTGPGTSLIRGIGGGGTGAYGVYYVYQTNLRVADTEVDSVSGTSTVGGIYTGLGTMNTAEITGNTVTNLSGTSSSVYGIYASSGTSFLVERNEVSGLSTTGAAVYGVYMSASGATISVLKNELHDIAYTGTSTSGAFGIYTAGGTTWTIANNFIYDVRAPGSSASTTPTAGMFISSGTTITCVYNTVLLNYTSTGASNSSAAVWVSATPTSADLRNNVFVNLVDVTTGTRAVAFRKGTTVLTNIAAATNTNLYYAGTPGAKNLIYYDGTNSDQTLAAYKARIATRDQSSVTENPPFLSTAAPYDLHMNTGIQTQTESGGTPVTSPIAVADDIDGNARNATTPDIGADEFNGIALDVTAPLIAYTPPGNSIVTPTRTLASTVSDGVSGVQKSVAGRPRVYYKKGAAGVYSSASGTEGPTNTWTFTVNHTTIGATAVGDTVYYYVAAQDSSDNSGTNPPGTSPTINPPNATVAAPNFYRIAASLAGSFTIGSAGPELATFPNVKAFFDSVNASVVTGAITATITTNVVESAPAVLNEAAYGVGGPFTITLAPAAATVDTVSGAFTGAVIQLRGADNVVLDGSNSGGSDRSLTILNTGTTAASAAVALSSLGAGLGSSNNTVKNLSLACGAAQNTGTTETFGIFAGGTAITTTSDGPDNNNNTLRNNVIVKARWGIYVRGIAGDPNTGTVIAANVVGPDSFGVLEIGKGGIALQYQSGPAVTGNLVKFVGGTYAQTTGGTDRIGIGLGAGDGWPTATATTLTGAVVTGNTIHDVADERTYSAIGIGLAASGTGTGNIIANNMMYNLHGNGTAGDMTVGLCLAAGDGDRVVYNSMLLTGDIDPSGGSVNSSTSSMGIRVVSSGVTNLTLKNNIASVDFTSNTATLKHYAVVAPSGYLWGTGGADNNVYHVNAANPQMVLGGIGTSTPFADVTTLTSWRTQFTPNQDAASVAGDPLFTGATDLHITSAASPASNAGMPIAGVATDLDGDARNAATPDIGADEFAGAGVATTVAAGWNMVSNPVTTTADSMLQLFPTSLLPYGFGFSGTGGYVQQYELTNGRGYWGKFPGATTVIFTGGTIAADTIPVQPGWNMIGSISSLVDTATITSIPPGLRTSNAWFGYSGGYNGATTIDPGKAYWVKAGSAGSFIFTAGPAPQKAAPADANPAAAMNTLTITDAAGHVQMLYFGEGDASLQVDMPPLPPEGAFDARFETAEGGAMLKTVAAGSATPIVVRSAMPPVTMTWNVQGRGYTLDAGRGLTALEGEGSVVITGPVTRLVLRFAGVEEIPTTYVLLQNYPNPFNPVTTIRFGLPAASRVRVEVVNLLGQRVATLVDNVPMEAGYHAVEWNSSGSNGLPLGSGVYFVRYTATGEAGATFTDIRKMMLLK